MPLPYRYGVTSPRPLSKWLRGRAGEIIRAAYFPAPAAPTTVYQGAKARSGVYYGTKTDADIYKGAGDLFP